MQPPETDGHRRYMQICIRQPKISWKAGSQQVHSQFHGQMRPGFRWPSAQQDQTIDKGERGDVGGNVRSMPEHKNHLKFDLKTTRLKGASWVHPDTWKRKRKARILRAKHRFSLHPEVEEFESFLDQLGRFRPGRDFGADFHGVVIFTFFALQFVWIVVSLLHLYIGFSLPCRPHDLPELCRSKTPNIHVICQSCCQTVKI